MLKWPSSAAFQCPIILPRVAVRGVVTRELPRHLNPFTVHVQRTKPCLRNPPSPNALTLCLPPSLHPLPPIPHTFTPPFSLPSPSHPSHHVLAAAVLLPRCVPLHAHALALPPARVLRPRLPPDRPGLGLHDALHPARRSPARSSSSPDLVLAFRDEELVEAESAGVGLWGARFVEGLAVCVAVDAESYGECVVFLGCWEGW
jgi:hypothetical protein